MSEVAGDFDKEIEQWRNYIGELYNWIMAMYNGIQNGEVSQEQYDEALKVYNKRIWDAYKRVQQIEKEKTLADTETKTSDVIEEQEEKQEDPVYADTNKIGEGSAKVLVQDQNISAASEQTAELTKENLIDDSPQDVQTTGVMEKLQNILEKREMDESFVRQIRGNL